MVKPSSEKQQSSEKQGSNWTKFQEGRAKTGGRKKGTPNKTPGRVAEALQAAFEGIGGEEAMTAYAKDDPAGFYKLYIRMLPAKIETSVNVHDTLMESITEARKRLAVNKKRP